MFLGLTGFIVLFHDSLPPFSYGEDLIEDYVSGRALLNGADPYAPLNDLIFRYMPSSTVLYPHPNAHPPLLILLGLPFAALPYQIAAPLWFLANVALLLLIGRMLKLSGWALLAPLAWPPLWTAVGLGGSELVLLALLVAAWRLADQEQDTLAGGLLGLAAALKLFPALFFVPFLFRRRWRVVGAGAGALVLGQLVNLAVVGPAALFHYYLVSLPTFNRLFIASEANVTPYGALLRLLGGAPDVRPLVAAPALAPVIAGIISLFALAALARLRPEAAPLAFLIATPSAWTNYVTLIFPQLLAMWRGGDRRVLLLLAAAAASWVMPIALSLPAFLVVLRGAGTHANDVAVLLGAVQPAGLIALLGLAWTGVGSTDPPLADVATPRADARV